MHLKLFFKIPIVLLVLFQYTCSSYAGLSPIHDEKPAHRDTPVIIGNKGLTLTVQFSLKTEEQLIIHAEDQSRFQLMTQHAEALYHIYDERTASLLEIRKQRSKPTTPK